MTDRTSTTLDARQAVARCTELTGSMLRAAADGDWEHVADLESERRSRCADIRPDGLAGNELEAVREPLRALVAMDERLVDRIREARAGALAALRAARGPARASAAYHSTGRSDLIPVRRPGRQG